METVSVQKNINGYYDVTVQHNETGSSIGITISEDALLKLGSLISEIKFEAMTVTRATLQQ